MNFPFFDSDIIKFSNEQFEEADKFIIIFDLELNDKKNETFIYNERFAKSLSYLLSNIDLSVYLNGNDEYDNDDSILRFIDNIYRMPELYVKQFSMIRDMRLHSSLLLSFFKTMTSNQIIQKIQDFLSEFIVLHIEKEKYLINLEKETKQIKGKINEKLNFYRDFSSIRLFPIISKRVTNKLIEIPLFKKGPFALALMSETNLFPILKNNEHSKKLKIVKNRDSILIKGEKNEKIRIQGKQDQLMLNDKKYYSIKNLLEDSLHTQLMLDIIPGKYKSMLQFLDSTFHQYIEAIFARKPVKYYEQIFENFEDFLLSFVKTFSVVLSNSDQIFYNKTKELEWITPQYLNIRSANINENLWIEAINEIRKFDNETLPSYKLQLIQNIFTCISLSINIFGNKEDTGSKDDLPLIIVFCLIKACPKYFTTDVKFLNDYVQNKKMLSNVNQIIEILLASIKLILSIESHLCDYFAAGNKINKIKSSHHSKLIESIQKECINFLKTLSKNDFANLE